jgi:hypothetical protein
MLFRKRTVFFVGVALALAFAVFAYWLFPISSLAAPEWEVTVVDDHGRPVEGMTVRDTVCHNPLQCTCQLWSARERFCLRETFRGNGNNRRIRH